MRCLTGYRSSENLYLSSWADWRWPPDEEEALDLLAEILGPAEDEERQARRKLCRRLGYLPLALDIAGRRMRANGWKAGAMLERLADEEKRLDEEPGTNVAVAFGLSYRALSEGGRRLFRGLGVFAEGGFTPAAVAGVLDLAEAETQRGLERLEALSLARPAERSGRCDLQPLLADYARALVRQAGEWETLARRHAEYFLAYAQQFKGDFDALEAEQANLLAAMDRAYELEDWEVVTKFGWAICPPATGYLGVRGYWAEARRRLAQAAEAARQLGDREGEAAFVGNAAVVAQSQGDYEAAREGHERVKAIFEEMGRREQVAVALHQLGMLSQDTGDYHQARQLYSQSLDIKRQLGDKADVATTLHNLGALAQDTGHYHQARQLYQQSLDIARQLGDKDGIARSLGQLGQLAELEKDYVTAVRYWAQALEMLEALGAPDREIVREWFARLREELGEDRFNEVLEEAERG